MNDPRALAAFAVIQGRDFLRGWIEGRSRYRGARDPRDVAASWFDARTIGRAASEAAVAYYRALDGVEPP